jgi:hypothetical protein
MIKAPPFCLSYQNNYSHWRSFFLFKNKKPLQKREVSSQMLDYSSLISQNIRCFAGFSTNSFLERLLGVIGPVPLPLLIRERIIDLK